MVEEKLIERRRNHLAEVEPTASSNAGLWLDKYLCGENQRAKSRKGKTVKAQLVEEAAAIIEIPLYRDFFDQWKKALTINETKLAKAKVEGRLAIGLGDDGVLETSITLHHTYGVPYIRGSALKGLAAAFARNRIGGRWKAEGYRSGKWEEVSQAYKIVFGETDDAGYVIFHDALYVPGSGAKGKALHADIITVHHSKYYSDAKENVVPPADWDEPIPVPFLSATGSYLIALSAPNGCEDWRDAAFDILRLALAEEGIGAKTSSGYGRMKLEANK
ncbi:MAG: type III-B CRISPR module RAMP protein Cmr6 [Blastocatellia bacterium]|nr:type III-B CRISPR module RAMP protein Cmr6 [Blastocatellia bacterium]